MSIVPYRSQPENEEEELSELAIETRLALWRRVLLSVPHGPGDHTDACRFAQGTFSPHKPMKCRCHVQKVQNALREKGSEIVWLDLLRNAEELVRKLEQEDCIALGVQQEIEQLQSVIPILKMKHL
ncbi:hypothetical protein ACQZV8_00650 [Magnetococcales bacterium HHB-1]